MIRTYPRRELGNIRFCDEDDTLSPGTMVRWNFGKTIGTIIAVEPGTVTVLWQDEVVPEIKLNIKTVAITGKSRKLKTKWIGSSAPSVDGIYLMGRVKKNRL
jgi:hypothetical protein